MEREALADELFNYVASVVGSHSDIDEILILSPLPPPAMLGCWQPDAGRGLNAELEALRIRLRFRDLVIIHADLPNVTHADLSQLLALAAKTGVAIAPDYRGAGTNALALRRNTQLRFSFGPDSLAAHRRSAAEYGIPDPAVFTCDGLSQDIDCSEDLKFIPPNFVA
jgi:2-phospho-L-lactate guanylyltransferase